MLEIRSKAGDLREERIVEGRDDGAAVSRGIEPHAKAAGSAVGVDLPVIRGEVLRGIFRRDAALQSGAEELNVVLLGQRERRLVQLRALCDQNLALHDVDAGDYFGYRVFDLDARIHFDEVELLGIGIDEELDGPGVVVAGGAHEAHRGVAKIAASLGGNRESGCDFDNLLMAALHRAIALIEVHEVAVLIAQDLHFNVAGARDIALQKHGAVTESGGSFLAGLVHFPGELLGIFDDAHATAAAAERRFDHEREADFPSEFRGLGGIGERFFRSGNDGNAGGFGEMPGSGFVAK